MRLIRRQLGEKFIRGSFRALVAALSLDPRRDPLRLGIAITRDIPYLPTGLDAHRLDIFSPQGADPTKPRPCVIYIHGGGFTGLSKETHALMALEFARRGYIVFNINYRLAPIHPFPAAPQDACAAYAWVVAHGARYGADLSRLVVAGESAGANLACVVAIAATTPRPEAWAKVAYAAGVAPRALLPACGMLQVSEPTRYFAGRPMFFLFRDRIEGVAAQYLDAAIATDRAQAELADPLCVFERMTAKPTRPFPACFAIAGTRDPVRSDSPRLIDALTRLGLDARLAEYPGGHVFHGNPITDAARRAWSDTFEFLTARGCSPSAVRSPRSTSASA